MFTDDSIDDSIPDSKQDHSSSKSDRGAFDSDHGNSDVIVQTLTMTFPTLING